MVRRAVGAEQTRDGRKPKWPEKWKAARFIHDKLVEKGYSAETQKGLTKADEVPEEVWAEIRGKFFESGVRTRTLKRLWEQREKLETAVKTAKAGCSGGLYARRQRKQGLGHQRGLGIRLARATDEAGKVRRPGKRTILKEVYERVKEVFLRWRKGGHYVDRGDLWVEFCHQADTVLLEIEGRTRVNGFTVSADKKLHAAIKKRLQACEKLVKNVEYTVQYMLDEFDARVYKPQRLLSIPLEEEERRALAGWQAFDDALRMATLDDVEELDTHVFDGQAFRDNVKDLVIFMSDQALFL